jgi:hypothetical protein
LWDRDTARVEIGLKARLYEISVVISVRTCNLTSLQVPTAELKRSSALS